MVSAASAGTWNLSSTCSKDLTCEVDAKYTSPHTVCGNKWGHLAGTSHGGKTGCMSSRH
ncbi:hypothetical protein CKAH01_18416 [Colletotrichum kahawae]|uniref:Uncharacterized protein n=1 Tax=Colletotrichum kahawae TaxID=34407 RepID=A0AAD9Y8H4_COLKA|nr:hypothetical protein CKAH01_18416 [Colletotrichum kahawae]